MIPRRIKQRICLIAIAVLLVFSLVISLNQWLFHWSAIPSWNELYVMAGLREDTTLSGEQFRMTAMDVGNADCILLQTGDKFALIDAGERESGQTLVRDFRRMGITRFEYVIATHPDSDHIGGMADIIQEFEIGSFLMTYMPQGYEPTTRVYENMLVALLDRNVTMIEPKHGDRYLFGSAHIDILSGLSEYTETNEQSIVCKVTFGKTRFLLTGDAGKEVEKEILASGVDVRADVLKVGHHGSRSSSDKAFLEAVSPSAAVITCGVGNAYNHPHKEVLNRLKAVGATIYRCDKQGQITVQSDGKNLTFSTKREGK